MPAYVVPGCRFAAKDSMNSMSKTKPFDALEDSATNRNTHQTLELISKLVPEFQPPEIGVKSIFADTPAETANQVTGDTA